MKPILRITAAVTAIILSTAAFGCDNKKSSDDTSSKESTSASQEDTTDDSETATDTTSTTTSGSGTTTTAASTSTTTTTVAATDKVQPTTAPAPEKGFESSYEAAKAYYNAYLTGNADAVYDMFCQEEIEGYHTYLNTTELLEGKNPQVVFKRSAVIDAINQSMGAIHGIMAEKSDLPHEKWVVSLTEESLKPVGENELKDFNKTLNTSFPEAADCDHIYYKDGNEEHSFIGNACAFVQFDGRWYLSYSTVMNAELITYMNIF
jgi:hypothetical protein